jgi:hypothetical protein
MSYRIDIMTNLHLKKNTLQNNEQIFKQNSIAYFYSQVINKKIITCYLTSWVRGSNQCDISKPATSIIGLRRTSPRKNLLMEYLYRINLIPYDEPLWSSTSFDRSYTWPRNETHISDAVLCDETSFGVKKRGRGASESFFILYCSLTMSIETRSTFVLYHFHFYYSKLNVV